VPHPRKNLKAKIASLSALGAGALVGLTGKAQAGVIYSGPIHVDVGVNGQAQFGLMNGPNTVLSFAFQNTHIAGSISSFNTRGIRAFGQNPFLAKFAATTAGNLLRPFNQGATFSNALKAGSNLLVGQRTWGTVAHGVHSALNGNLPFTQKYALFRFKVGAGPTEYGWLQLSYSVTKGFGPANSLGPDLTITGWAYDNSGVKLAAGASPEPGTMGLAAFGALALGAAGLRRWRKSRRTD
jgi:hypothetical protein